MISFRKPDGFRLAAATEFYKGFTPGSGMAAACTDELTLAFGLDGSFAPVAVALREDGDAIVADHTPCEPLVLRQQIARILGLDADGAAWRAIGERDPVIGGLQRAFPGFFTAAKASPYDAATWSVIAPRMNMAQAAAIKQRIAREHGDVVTLRGRTHHVFPGPAALATLDKVEGLAEEKVARLRGVGIAAMRGALDVARLRGLGEAAAIASLQELRGIGPWSAAHIYFRGAAPVDAVPHGEPRLLHGLSLAYGIEAPSDATFARIAEAWRPFRMWASILLMRNLAGSPRWHAPGLAKERAARKRHVRGTVSIMASSAR